MTRERLDIQALDKIVGGAKVDAPGQGDLELASAAAVLDAIDAVPPAPDAPNTDGVSTLILPDQIFVAPSAPDGPTSEPADPPAPDTTGDEPADPAASDTSNGEHVAPPALDTSNDKPVEQVEDDNPLGTTQADEPEIPVVVADVVEVPVDPADLIESHKNAATQETKTNTILDFVTSVRVIDYDEGESESEEKSDWDKIGDFFSDAWKFVNTDIDVTPVTDGVKNVTNATTDALKDAATTVGDAAKNTVTTVVNVFNPSKW